MATTYARLHEKSRLFTTLAQLTDRQLVNAFLRATAGMNAAVAGALVDVSHETVGRWRRGAWKRIYPETRDAIQGYLRRAGVPEGLLREALDFFSDVEVVTQYFEGVAPPGEKKALKVNALRAYRRFLTARQPEPEWMVELEQRIERGEL